ncbi:restriction endonuclease subunit S, partial [Acinetobacter nosocomialis]|uniref:restriction endonuclease subunit S n=1 Tax=Acinetobacter nosocomialis TaxID=106654 RepID=UPI0030FCE9A0
PVTGVKNKYLAICLMDTKLLEITIRKAKATAGQSNLTLEICRDFPIPIPPIEEQIEIIELVNKLLGNASNIEKLVESAQKRVN